MTYYEILEISEKASPEVIHMAYKALCKKYHPDICQGDKKQAEERMKKINEAYDTLSDEKKKRQYDYILNTQSRRQQSYYTPKQENNVPNADALVKRGFIALEYGEWIKAENFFEQALNQNAGLAEAYLGKLMVELRVKTRNALKDCPHPFNDKLNYKRAYSFANDSLKRFLQETIQYINKRNYETQCSIIYNRSYILMRDSITIQGFQAAIAEFEKIREYKDSAKKIEYCYEKIAEINSAILASKAEKEKRDYETKCNNIYYYACVLMRGSNNVQGFKDAIAEFEKIRDYKDSDKKIEQCYQKIAEIKSATLATEAEKEKRKTERKEAFLQKLPLVKKLALIIVPILIISIVATIILPKIKWNNENMVNSSSSDTISSEKISNHTLSSEVSSSIDTSSNSSSKNPNQADTPTLSAPTSSKPPSTTVTHAKGCCFENGAHANILAKEKGILTSCYDDWSATMEGVPAWGHTRIDGNIVYYYTYDCNAQLLVAHEFIYSSKSHKDMVKNTVLYYDTAGNVIGKDEGNYTNAGLFETSHSYTSTGIVTRYQEFKYDTDGNLYYEYGYNNDDNGNRWHTFERKYIDGKLAYISYDAEGNIVNISYE